MMVHIKKCLRKLIHFNTDRSISDRAAPERRDLAQTYGQQPKRTA
jgi:hypothetical protein